MDGPEHVVIVGAGQGGLQAASSLRDGGFTGRVTLLGDEPGLPYQRPPLSKAYLTGKADDDAVRLRARPFFAEARIDLRPSVRVDGVDRGAARLRLSDGATLPYDHLVLATGARARPLAVPGREFDGVVGLRTLADAALVKARLPSVRRAVVIGAGFIGLEFAAVATAAGIAVTVLEATGRPMARALSAPTSAFFADAHAAMGTELRFGSVAARVTGRDGSVTGVETMDGRHVAADLVLVGIGVLPNMEIAAEAGLRVENGISVDEELLTADAAISALGDCTEYPQAFAGGARMRLESVQNAIDGARCVSARLCGRPAPFRALPWFWSDQGPHKLQIAGLAVPHGETVLRGDPASGAFSTFCFDGERLVAVETVNRPADHMAARRLLGAGHGLTRDEAADPAFDLRARAAGTGLAPRP